jgi:hypothetical protein
MDNFEKYDNENSDKQIPETENCEMNAPIRDVNDYNGEFIYEDFDTVKGMNGMSYLDYLRLHDDMI